MCIKEETQICESRNKNDNKTMNFTQQSISAERIKNSSIKKTTRQTTQTKKKTNAQM